jgi:hypothetical protein
MWGANQRLTDVSKSNSLNEIDPTMIVSRPYRECGIEVPTRRFDTRSDDRIAKGVSMPEKETIERAREDAREGKSPSTQAGEFVREEIHHVREGKHGVRSPQQAIAIGLSKARRAGVKLSPPKGSSSLRRKAAQDTNAGKETPHKKSATRSRATSGALKRESKTAASRKAISQQAKKSASRRGPGSRHAAAVKAAHTRRAA